MQIGIDYVGVGCWATIVNDKNETLLLRRKSKDIWERPGGKLEVGESFESCLKREVKEETGIDIEILNFLNISQIYDSNKKSHWVAIGYLCKYKSGVAKVIEDKKHDDVKWFHIDQLPKITEYTKNALEIYKNKS